jgi:hypothetical protein
MTRSLEEKLCLSWRLCGFQERSYDAQAYTQGLDAGAQVIGGGLG